MKVELVYDHPIEDHVLVSSTVRKSLLSFLYNLHSFMSLVDHHHLHVDVWDQIEELCGAREVSELLADCEAVGVLVLELSKSCLLDEPDFLAPRTVFGFFQ